MLNKKMYFPLIFSILGMVLFSGFLSAHSPDLSSLMIYEQNGKNLVVMKGSLTAFEGEIIYNYTKNSYKNSQEFNELVIKYFKRSCFIVINSDTIKYINPQVQLGHETTFFAELENVPQKITSCHVKNIFFKDMPNNQCELILSINGLPQKQNILANHNKHEVKLTLENNQWIVEELHYDIFSKNNLFLWVGLLLVNCLTIILIMRKKKNIS